MAQERKVLGRGLDHLLGRQQIDSRFKENLNQTPRKTSHQTTPETSKENRVLKIGIEKITPNPQQPRQFFDEDKIQELASSIQEQGLIQPIVVGRSSDGNFYIIAGERRWRAVQKLGWQRVPVVVKEEALSTEKKAVLALVENLQREDLNAMEEAKAYQDLLETTKWTQKDLAQKVGKDRSTIANSMRFLELHPEAQKLLQQNKISLSIAKVLLQEESLDKQKILARQASYEKWTVRELERRVQRKSLLRNKK